jgi:hypothetical protein
LVGKNNKINKEFKLKTDVYIDPPSYNAHHIHHSHFPTMNSRYQAPMPMPMPTVILPSAPHQEHSVVIPRNDPFVRNRLTVIRSGRYLVPILGGFTVLLLVAAALLIPFLNTVGPIGLTSLAAASTFSSASFMLGAGFVYCLVGIGYAFSAGKECYEGKKNLATLFKSRIIEGHTVTSIMGAMIWAPFLVIGGLIGMGANAVRTELDKAKSKPGEGMKPPPSGKTSHYSEMNFTKGNTESQNPDNSYVEEDKPKYTRLWMQAKDKVPDNNPTVTPPTTPTSSG